MTRFLPPLNSVTISVGTITSPKNVSRPAIATRRCSPSRIESSRLLCTLRMYQSMFSDFGSARLRRLASASAAAGFDRRPTRPPAVARPAALRPAAALDRRRLVPVGGGLGRRRRLSAGGGASASRARPRGCRGRLHRRRRFGCRRRPICRRSAARPQPAWRLPPSARGPCRLAGASPAAASLAAGVAGKSIAWSGWSLTHCRRTESSEDNPKI